MSPDERGRLLSANSTVDALRVAMDQGEFGLKEIPLLVRAIVDTDAWRDRITKLGQRATFASFEAFVEADPLAGLGTTVRQLTALCRDDTVALDAIDRACQRPNGVHAPIDNVQSTPTGNASAAAIRRLRKDRPDLHARVLAGEISPHGAMVQAGFRPRTVTIPLDPERAARALRRHFSDDELAAIIAAVGAA